MKPSSHLLAALCVAVAALSLQPEARAQTDLLSRSAIVPESNFANDYTFSPDVPNYNLRIGPVDFAFGIGVGLEYNDNIRLAPSGQEESDFILRPFADVSAMWRVTELNTLTLNLGVGYSKYLDNSDLDSGGLLISPTSALSFQFFCGGLPGDAQQLVQLSGGCHRHTGTERHRNIQAV